MSNTRLLCTVLLGLSVLIFGVSLAATSGARISTIDPCTLLTAEEEAELGLVQARKEFESSSPVDEDARKKTPKFQSCAYKLLESTTRVVFVAPLERSGAAQAMIDQLAATATPGSAEYVTGAVVKEINGGVCTAVPFFGAFVLSTCLGIRENAVLWIVRRAPTMDDARSMRTQTIFEAVASRIRMANSLSERTPSGAVQR